MTARRPSRAEPGSGRGRLSRRRFLAAGGAALLLAGARGAEAQWVFEPGGGVSPPAFVTLPQALGVPPFPPDFQPSDVSLAGPEAILNFFAGHHPRYPNAGLANFLGFSPADILETMDTVVLDGIAAERGDDALPSIYRLIARQALEALLDLYTGRPLVLALDAGHGGRQGVFFEPGSNGTEAMHVRRVVSAIEALAPDPRYQSIVIRRIFNDAIGDDFGLPPPEDRKDRPSLVMRSARASMLAYEADDWNHAHPEAPVAVHTLSVHFNANSHGILVLHEGDAVPSYFHQLSLAYAHAYIERARPVLNGSGLLPYPLDLVLGTGMHDDILLYPPPNTGRAGPVNPFTGADRRTFQPPRYAMLQASLLERDYVDGALRYYKLVPG